MEFEEWIREQVERGVFENEEEAYKVLAYLFYRAERENTAEYLRRDHFPLNLEKAKKYESEIIDEDKIAQKLSDILKDMMEDTVKDMMERVEILEHKATKIEKMMNVLKYLKEVIDEFAEVME